MKVSTRLVIGFFCVVTVVVLLLYVSYGSYGSYGSYAPEANLYVQSFLTDEDFQKVVNDFHHRSGSLASEHFSNVVRQNLFVPNDSVVYEILHRYTDRLRELIGNPRVYLARNHPIEYRRYFPGSFMKRHRDVQLYEKPQYECILTLFNSSDSRTVFYDKQTTSIRSEPNSLMFVRANGVQHEVLPITRGERCFIKFIMTETDERIY